MSFQVISCMPPKKSKGFNKNYVFVEATEELLQTVPKEAKRIQVKNVNDKLSWKMAKNIILGQDQVATIDGEVVHMKGRIGRPRLDDPPPLHKTRPSTGATLAKVPGGKKKAPAHIRRRQKFFQRDPLLRRALDNPDSDDILAIAIQELAVESSTLAYERVVAEADNREASQLSIRRIKAIQGVVDIWLKRREMMAGKTIDLNGKAFLSLFEFLVETFRDSMTSAKVAPDQIQMAITELSGRISEDDWIHQAQEAMLKNS